MKHILGLIVGLFLVFSVTGAAQATTIDFTNGYTSPTASIDFGVVTVTADAWNTNINAFQTADVGQYLSYGLGVTNSSTDNSHQIDGSGYHDRLILTFDYEVTLNSATFWGLDWNDDIRLWVDGSYTDLSSSLLPNPVELYVTGTVFGFEATEWNDEYKLQSVDYTQTTNPVPEPASMILLGCGLIGLTGARKKKS